MKDIETIAANLLDRLNQLEQAYGVFEEQGNAERMSYFEGAFDGIREALGELGFDIMSDDNGNWTLFTF